MSTRLHRGAGALVAVTLAAAWVIAGGAAAPRFFPDDPIRVDDDRALDAAGAEAIEGSNAFDFLEHTFLKPGDRQDVRAMNVNTMDEVPDSSWFTNRIGVRDLSIDEIVAGPNRLPSLDVDGWPIVQQKSSGITPGFRLRDPDGRLYQLKFDPPSNPEMSSGAEVISAAFYHAVGYNVVEAYIVEFDPDLAPIDGATMVDMRGIEREMRREDVDEILQRAARLPNGRYRALASRFADGRPLGHFKYYGTRPDDPNDIHPHEHRRELRASRVIGAWLNHDDSRGLNSLDMLEADPASGQEFVRHYVFDFGSTLGSGSTRPQVPRAGNEYILEWGPGLRSLVTLGWFPRPWVGIDYPQVPPAVGRFEARAFDPVRWRPEYPNPAFDNMRPDDAFWGARLVQRFSDEAIAAVVSKADFSDPVATDYLARTLIERRDKVVAAWITGVNPVAEPALDADGTFRFINAAVDAGVVTSPVSYRLRWAQFDNVTGERRSPTVVDVDTPESRVPAPVLEGADFVSVEIETRHETYPQWAQPVTVYFRRSGAGWDAVGLDREPRGE